MSAVAPGVATTIFRIVLATLAAVLLARAARLKPLQTERGPGCRIHPPAGYLHVRYSDHDVLYRRACMAREIAEAIAATPVAVDVVPYVEVDGCDCGPEAQRHMAAARLAKHGDSVLVDIVVPVEAVRHRFLEFLAAHEATHFKNMALAALTSHSFYVAAPVAAMLLTAAALLPSPASAWMAVPVAAVAGLAYSAVAEGVVDALAAAWLEKHGYIRSAEYLLLDWYNELRLDCETAAMCIPILIRESVANAVLRLAGGR